MRFHNKVVVITGAAGGIGRVTAKAFAEEGAKLVLVDLHMDALERLQAEVDFPTESTLFISGDVSKEEDVEHYTNQAIQHFGRIDVLFNNAGIEGSSSRITDCDFHVFDQVFQVNVRGAALGMKHVLRVMTEQNHGVIINTSSIAGKIGAPGFSPYSASKHALLGLTKSVAQEVAPYGVRVLAICPSPVETRMMRAFEVGAGKGDLEQGKKLYEQGIPLGRYAQPDEIASLVLFLASDEAKFLTGTHYSIDGGLSSKSL